MNDYLVKMLKWEKRTSWDDILTPHGWTFPAIYAPCGCAYVTRPVGTLFPLTPKSAVTHDDYCLRDSIDCPTIQILSTHVPGQLGDMALEAMAKGEQCLFTKLEVYKILNFGGDIDAALKSLGIVPPTVSTYDDHNLLVVGVDNDA